MQALTLMGSSAVGAEESCSSCHSLGRATLSHWRQLTVAANDECLTNALALQNVAVVDELLGCIRWEENLGPFEATGLGIYSAAAHLDWFSFAFEHALTPAAKLADQARRLRGHGRHAARRRARGRRRSSTSWPSGSSAACRASRSSCRPTRHRRVQPSSTPTSCSRTSTAMKTAGWRAKNAENGLLMYGCSRRRDHAECLSELPLARDTAYGADWDVAGIVHPRAARQQQRRPRVLVARVGRRSLHGLGAAVEQPARAYGAQIVDLQRDVVIAVNGGYDSGFFPDNSGFVYQQARATVRSMCPTEPAAAPRQPDHGQTRRSAGELRTRKA